MNFLTILKNCFHIFTDKSGPEEKNHVENSEYLSRFLFSERHFQIQKNIVTYAAFLPPTQKTEISVYRSNTLDTNELWEIGKNHVEPSRGKPILGKADVMASSIRKIGLDAVSDPHPHYLHANIIGFSLEKSAQKMQAITLALQASLILK